MIRHAPTIGIGIGLSLRSVQVSAPDPGVFNYIRTATVSDVYIRTGTVGDLYKRPLGS